MPPKDVFSGAQQPIGNALDPNSAIKNGTVQTGPIRTIDPGLLASLADTVVLYPGPLHGAIRSGQPDQVSVDVTLNHPSFVDAAGFGFGFNLSSVQISFGGALAARNFQISFQWNRAPGQFQQASAPFALELSAGGKVFNTLHQDAGAAVSSVVRFALAGDDLLKADKGSGCAITLRHDLASGSATHLAFSLLQS